MVKRCEERAVCTVRESGGLLTASTGERLKRPDADEFTFDVVASS